MTRTFALIIAGFLAASPLLAGPAPAAEKAENPVYKSWEHFGKGAAVVYKQVSEIGSTRYESTMTYTLVEKTPDKVVVEMQVTTRVNGVETRNRPMKMETPRAMTLPQGVKPAQVGKVEGQVAEGEETVKIAGRDLKSRWYKSKTKVEHGDAFTQSWSSDEVPGGLIKSLTTTPDNKSSMSMELVEIKAP